MKAIILAGGLGTRISEQSQFKPKPMIEIGEYPILWHIMKIYSHYGVNEFVICAGYKQHIIKKWFADYYLHTSDITFDFANDNNIIIHDKRTENWKVTVVDTGLETATGGRVKRVQKYIGNETFCLTYGDAVSDVNINDVIAFHNSHGKTLTLSAVSFAQQKGVLEIADDNSITSFREKSGVDNTMINGGFMVCNPQVFNLIAGDNTSFEAEPMDELIRKNELMCYQHGGFWQCMDTKREKDKLDAMWESGNAPWKVWKD